MESEVSAVHLGDTKLPSVIRVSYSRDCFIVGECCGKGIFSRGVHCGICTPILDNIGADLSRERSEGKRHAYRFVKLIIPIFQGERLDPLKVIPPHVGPQCRREADEKLEDGIGVFLRAYEGLVSQPHEDDTVRSGHCWGQYVVLKLEARYLAHAERVFRKRGPKDGEGIGTVSPTSKLIKTGDRDPPSDAPHRKSTYTTEPESFVRLAHTGCPEHGVGIRMSLRGTPRRAGSFGYHIHVLDIFFVRLGKVILTVAAILVVRASLSIGEAFVITCSPRGLAALGTIWIRGR